MTGKAQQSVSVHRLQIERIIHRGEFGCDAEFMAGEWLCCTAMIDSNWAASGRIQARPTIMTVEQASTMAIAISMAINWIAEELATP